MKSGCRFRGNAPADLKPDYPSANRPGQFFRPVRRPIAHPKIVKPLETKARTVRSLISPAPMTSTFPAGKFAEDLARQIYRD